MTDLLVAVIFHQIGPYHHARLNAASCSLRVIGIEWSGREAYPWGQSASRPGYGKVTLFPNGEVEHRTKAELGEAIGNVLDEVKPNVVAVNGWNDFGSLITIRCCGRREIPMVVMSESSQIDEPRKWWTELFKRRLVDVFRAGLVGGQSHRDYLEELGMPAQRVFTGYDAVDNTYFAQGAKEVRSKESSVFAQGFDATGKSGIRRRYGLPENYFLASARFIEKKNLATLLRAYAAYRERSSLVTGHSSLWHLVLLGDGPLKADLCRLISDLGLQNSVLLPGFKQYGELPAYYGLAGAFIHASTSEQWGLVVNEAMASGLPVLVSKRCGCAADLIQEGRNGFTFDPEKIEEMAELMMRMTAAPSRLREMGDASQEIISQWGPDHFARGLDAAARTAMEVGPKRMRLTDTLMLEGLIRR